MIADPTLPIDIKVGDLITTYYQGVWRARKFFDHCDSRGHKTPQVEFENVCDSTYKPLRINKGRVKSCALAYCKKFNAREAIEELKDEIERIAALVAKENPL